jgi:hypothetical protein
VLDKVVYYAITDETSRPPGVLRRTRSGGLQTDEVFSRELRWVPSPLLIEAEHGDISSDFTEISEAEADQIMARIRANAPNE